MRHWRAIGIIELPGYAPLIAAQLWRSAREFHSGRVEVRESPFRIGGVNRYRQRVDHLPKTAFAFGQRSLNFLLIGRYGTQRLC